ncbi:MAG: lysophospholipid acyltransferase family protein [Elusimicrobiota bacterium]
MSLWLSVPLRLLLLGLGLLSFCLPRGAELRLGPAVGRLMFRLGFFKRKTVLENLRHCFPELTSKELRRLAIRNFEHYGILFFEYLHFFAPVRGHYRDYVSRHARLHGLERWKKAHAKGKGVIFVACHLGHWEMLASAGGMAGIPLTIVTKVLKPRWLHDQITAARLSTGVAAAHEPGSAPVILRALRRGGSVAFMNDQYTKPPMGLLVRFFGVKVGTLSVAGTLARRTGAAVLPTYTYRDAEGICHVVIEPEMSLARDRDTPEAATQAVSDKVEQWVRRHPTQWLWMHRRFKNVTWPVPELTPAAGPRPAYP